MKRKCILACCVLCFATLFELSFMNWIQPVKEAKITPIHRGVDVDFVSNYTRAYCFTGASILGVGIFLILTRKKHLSTIYYGFGLAVGWLTMTLMLGCPDTGSPYARISSGVRILYWRDPPANPPISDYQDWMIDEWQIEDPILDPNQNQITRMRYAKHDFHIYLKDDSGNVIAETGTKYDAQVIGHYDFSACQWLPDGVQDKWEAMGSITSLSSDETGDSTVSLSLGEEDGDYWTGYTATYVDVKLTCPMAPWTPIYLKATFVDQYPGDEISWDDTLNYSIQDSGASPTSNPYDGLETAGDEIFDRMNINWDSDGEMMGESSGGYVIDPNEYSQDPNVSFYSNKWCRIEAQGLVESTYIYPAYPLLPIPTPELMGMDPNMDPNDFPYWDPNSPLYKFVDPMLVDPSYLENYNPYYCTFKYGLPEGMSLPYIHPFSSSTAYLLSKKEDGSYFPLRLPIRIQFIVVNYEENWIIGITQPIIPCCCWLYNDFYWTGGYFGDKVFLSADPRGQLLITLPWVYGDFNIDGAIDIIDLTMFSQCWLADVSVYPNNYELSVDSNLDGRIDMIDLCNFIKAMNE